MNSVPRSVPLTSPVSHVPVASQPASLEPKLQTSLALQYQITTLEDKTSVKVGRSLLLHIASAAGGVLMFAGAVAIASTPVGWALIGLGALGILASTAFGISKGHNPATILLAGFGGAVGGYFIVGAVTGLALVGSVVVAALATIGGFTGAAVLQGKELKSRVIYGPADPNNEYHKKLVSNITGRDEAQRQIATQKSALADKDRELGVLAGKVASDSQQIIDLKVDVARLEAQLQARPAAEPMVVLPAPDARLQEMQAQITALTTNAMLWKERSEEYRLENGRLRSERNEAEERLAAMSSEASSNSASSAAAASPSSGPLHRGPPPRNSNLPPPPSSAASPLPPLSQPPGLPSSASSSTVPLAPPLPNSNNSG